MSEQERKRVLDTLNVLDTLPEAFSDAVAAAAAAIANVPISAIALVDTERQWFKGKCGLEVDETGRDVSFCAHAILQTEPLIVADARRDPRFANNPLVTSGLRIRFYAGFPLVVAGQPVGALCVMDDRPRTLDELAVQQLQQLAHGTAVWLTERRMLENSLARTKDELQYVTFHDANTGLPNRMMFQQRLKEATARSDRERRSVAVLSVELTGMEAWRHSCRDYDRDATIRALAKRLTTTCRLGDIVAYSGGDQFLVCMEGLDNIETVINLSGRLIEAVAEACDPGNCNAGASAWIGVTIYPTDGDVASLVGNASAASQVARNEAGARTRFFRESMNAKSKARADLLTELRRALERNELCLYFQPKLFARTGEIAGAEALIRWNHPVRGTLGPNLFIPVAEECGLIAEIGRWVIAEACRQLKAWRDEGMVMRLAINLSAQELRQPALAGYIAARLADAEINPALLTCEITESVAMDDAMAALRLFEELSAIGVRLSIDDFGTGYSSLSYLRKFPVHQLKIDRSFVTDLEHSEDARAVASAIVNLAHALRLEVVAEGVETLAQSAILLELGCDKLQGYLFARPMEPTAFFRWVLDHARPSCEEPITPIHEPAWVQSALLERNSVTA